MGNWSFLNSQNHAKSVANVLKYQQPSFMNYSRFFGLMVNYMAHEIPNKFPLILSLMENLYISQTYNCKNEQISSKTAQH
jgi:hypothetical protein